MTKKLAVLFIAFAIAGMMILSAGNGAGRGDGTGTCIFVDEDGDGINDNFRDHDGDGIPNYLDPDWVKPEDGTGYKAGNGKMNRSRNRNNFNNGSGSFNSFQNLNNYGGNFGTGECDGTGTGGNNGKRKKGGRG